MSSGLRVDTGDDRGVTLALVALSITVLIGICGLAIETGRLWTERRAMVTATDAAANAAAGAFGKQEDGCAEAATYLAANGASAAGSTCDYSLAWHGRSGVVQVETTTTVDYGLGRFLGLESGTVQSSTAVIWGKQIYTNIRPFAFCSAANADLNAWIQNPATELVVRFSLDSSQNVAQCTADGQAAGNWGTVDFDGGSNSTGETQNWLVNGYEGVVLTSDLSISCTVDSTACFNGGPGILAPSISSEMSLLSGLGPTPFLIYDYAEGGGSGLQFRISGVALAEVIGYRINGQESGRYLDMRFVPGLVSDNWDSDISRVCGETLSDCVGVGL